MKIKPAVVMRIKGICAKRGIKYNELAVKSGVTPSTVYSMLSSERKEIALSTVKKLCDGLDISITDFFSAEEFSDLEQEID